jgi:methylenetetrahydrofolate dehydrogenase (NADP+) / methenyltetrahydrofolate cyclohydrolase
MTATLIDGTAIAKQLRQQIAVRVATLKVDHHIQPCLAVVLVGNDSASELYVHSKARLAKEVGIEAVDHRLPAQTSTQELVALIHSLNSQDAIHGILVQLPLPEQIDSQAVIAAIDPRKDVDGFTPANVGRFVMGMDAFTPCTPLGCLILIQSVTTQLAGKHALIIGRSNIVGKPMAQLLLKQDCTVTIAHSKSQNLAALCKQADIVVAAIGEAHMIKGEWIKPGAIVIDVGINREESSDEGKTRVTGDVEFEVARERALAITPVPGGVGPMTIACLLLNVVNAAIRQRVGKEASSLEYIV